MQEVWERVADGKDYPGSGPDVELELGIEDEGEEDGDEATGSEAATQSQASSALQVRSQKYIIKCLMYLFVRKLSAVEAIVVKSTTVGQR